MERSKVDTKEKRSPNGLNFRSDLLYCIAMSKFLSSLAHIQIKIFSLYFVHCFFLYDFDHKQTNNNDLLEKDECVV